MQGVNSVGGAREQLLEVQQREEANRYSGPQWAVISRYFDAIRRLRKTGKVAPSIILRQLQYLRSYPADLVVRACAIHLERHRDKPEAYTRGILRGLARHRGVDRGGRTGAVKESAAQRGNWRKGRYAGRSVDDLPL